MTSLFAGIERTHASQENVGNYFAPGNYRVRIENVFLHKKRLGGHLFIVETTVLGSDSEDVKVGGQYNWTQPLELDSAMSRIKLFLGAAQGLCPRAEADRINSEITETFCEAAISGKNPLKNVVLDLTCFNKSSLKTGKNFTLHLWNPIKDVV